ncbi:MAG TPA: hypothetical protein VLH35_07635 [Candidatus Acidoferrales bacterium]|nr:hypothetical protein [Candidatus Acidoferrales bacterium]
MPNRRVKRKRNKAIILMLLPALIFIGIVGWLISSMEPPHRKAHKTNHNAPIAHRANDGITFIPAIYEDSNEIINH